MNEMHPASQRLDELSFGLYQYTQWQTVLENKLKMAIRGRPIFGFKI